MLVVAFRVIEADRATLIAIGVYVAAVFATKKVTDHLIERRSPQLVTVGAPAEGTFDDELWDPPGEPDRAEYLWKVSFFFATALAIDAFWYTDWLVFATETSRYVAVSHWTAAVTITITTVCVVVAFFWPLLLGAWTYVEARAELAQRHKRRGGTTMEDDFKAVAPTVVSIVVAFAHFPIASVGYALLT